MDEDAAGEFRRQLLDAFLRGFDAAVEALTEARKGLVQRLEAKDGQS